MTRARSFLATLLVLGLTASVPGAVLAGSFTRPVELPRPIAGEPNWKFAVNDRGQAVAVTGGPNGTGLPNGALIYPVMKRGGLGRPWLLRIPGGFDPSIASVSLDDRGRIAVAVSYTDYSHIATEEHEANCCEHVALASWTLGAQPPMAQVLSAPGDDNHRSEVNGPDVVIGPRAITALWTTGGEQQFEGPLEGHLDEAFGPIGRPLRPAVLMRAPHGISTFHLTLSRNGRPVASWLSDRTNLRTVAGQPNGSLDRPHRDEIVPHVNIPEGFSSDFGGHTVFTYWSTWHRPGVLMAMSSGAGGRFRGPRPIARGFPEGSDATVAIGGRGAILAAWSCLDQSRACEAHSFARAGNLFGPLGNVIRLPHQGIAPIALVDGSDHALLVYETGGHLDAISTPVIGDPLGRPRNITPGLRECVGATGDAEAPSVASSVNGYAIFDVECRESNEYLVRYAP